MSDQPWRDPNHPGNKIRPSIRCANCGTKGCITAWGPWCFNCNVKRMTHLSAQFGQLAANLEKLDERDTTQRTA